MAAGSLALQTGACSPQSRTSVEKSAVVSVTRIKNDDVSYAVEEALDLLGGIEAVAAGKERIMLKPNLVAESPHCTTKPGVIEALARLMTKAGKDVMIGEGSASCNGFNKSPDFGPSTQSWHGTDKPRRDRSQRDQPERSPTQLCKPNLVPWNSISGVWGTKELE